MSHPFHIVDVFAEQRYTGNQLAVVREAGDLSDREMEQLAAEMNYSETTFIESETASTGGYPIRIFTPETELPFAGHPTLGTACVLREALGEDGAADEVISLSLGVGEVPVTVERGADEGNGSEEGNGEDNEDERFWMDQPDPSFGEWIDRPLAASVLSLEADALDPDFAPRVVSTGLETLVVPLRSIAPLQEARLEETSYEELLEETGAGLVLAVCAETARPENDLHVRVFAAAHGVYEDPATGSANGCLGAYLARERYFGSASVDVRVEQGYELDRPSLLCLRATDREDRASRAGREVRASRVERTENAATGERNGMESRDEAGSGVAVRVGGRVIPVAVGELL